MLARVDSAELTEWIAFLLLESKDNAKAEAEAASKSKKQ